MKMTPMIAGTWTIRRNGHRSYSLSRVADRQHSPVARICWQHLRFIRILVMLTITFLGYDRFIWIWSPRVIFISMAAALVCVKLSPE